MEQKGVIYILTNPSFPQYVKIGYADNVESRLKQLNNSECIPFAFRIYATYEVEERLTDLKLHALIDQLNPNLRSIDEVDGKKRVREFYAMSPEAAYALLEAIAEIHGCTDKLKLWDMDANEVKAEEEAQEISEERKERLSPFAFSKCNIKPGETIYFYADPELTCTVVDDKHVSYNGETWSLTALAKHLTGTKSAIAGPKYFKYKGEWLNTIRHRLGV